jgi:UDP-glucuronate decarboxylase
MTCASVRISPSCATLASSAFACPASQLHYQMDPVQTAKTSVSGVINMLGLAKRPKVRILQVFTSDLYGDPNVRPQSEDYWGNGTPIASRSCYDEGCAETLFFDSPWHKSLC